MSPLVDQNILDNIGGQDRQELLRLLNEFILQSYKVEKEFKDYKALYEWVIEILPQAIWVINENKSFFYKNSKAIESQEVFEKAKALGFNTEIEHAGKNYLFQNNKIQGKEIITATDITKQKRQERLVSMGKISAHLAHEIRNPVGSISLLTSVLLKKVDDKTKPIVFELQRALWRVERIIKATLLFSKGVHANKIPQSLSLLEDEIKEALNQYSYTKDISLKTAIAPLMASYDLSLLSIALQNFLYNAIDAIEEGAEEEGHIEVCAFEENEWVVFHIKDDGKEVLDKELLFEPFETTKLKGNGLGLALSLQVVQAHGGKITLLESAEKTFEIRILKDL
ncbi:sensor histidine kinase [Helicobacter ailurogastricus]|uniref:sensor histidine kinase n=1 Tax=Helicobacter ailurogastricus TaxID=1578720 RepID=UPI0006B57630|nr:ATP-binding protein [Helicobacter ailurogastricus]BDQ28872.1 two-component sensor histidine kinase [Helicobacter ailurogastricus]GLH58664.1 Signal-transducing protein, histidine kinase AtoS [Helicobacter ailurogastricus]GLH59465.1 Signal-transducing protein, histidine kinase AtoS [Helicobacter ailurogastricus]GMB90482.1 Signal-transducing protein, histidine kinase AtoS [Helicobacter ailurogastricus]GMB92117.1 Signal-transducing protein, histidine kinase AtoS [Helicobacter ailurogastricus]